jgi:carbon starvation protein
MSNQLLASSALIIVTTMLIRIGKAKYLWVTAVPGIFLAFITMYAGYLNITNVFLPKKLYLLASIAAIVMSMMAIVFVASFKRWFELLRITERVQDVWGESVLIPLEGEEMCLLPTEPDKSLQAKIAQEKWG